MRCSEAQEQLVAAHDGELGPSAIEVLEEHLASCPRCRRWDEHLRALPIGGRLRVPPDIQRALEARTDPRQLVPSEDSRASSGRWPMLAAAAAALLLTVGVTQEFAGRAIDPPTTVHAPIPAGQWRPAAYQPGVDDVPAYDTNVLHLPAPPSDGGTR